MGQAQLSAFTCSDCHKRRRLMAEALVAITAIISLTVIYLNQLP
jgi:hypothetical protein